MSIISGGNFLVKLNLIGIYLFLKIFFSAGAKKFYALIILLPVFITGKQFLPFSLMA